MREEKRVKGASKMESVVFLVKLSQEGKFENITTSKTMKMITTTESVWQPWRLEVQVRVASDETYFHDISLSRSFFTVFRSAGLLLLRFYLVLYPSPADYDPRDNKKKISQDYKVRSIFPFSVCIYIYGRISISTFNFFLFLILRYQIIHKYDNRIMINYIDKLIYNIYIYDVYIHKIVIDNSNRETMIM